MSPTTQPWRLVCLRRYPTRQWLSSLHALSFRRFVHDIHPLDADNLVATVATLPKNTGLTFYTLSTVLIDRFVPVGEEDLRHRLQFHEGKGHTTRYLTTDEARMIYEAWRVGVETLSEILLTRGIWR